MKLPLSLHTRIALLAIVMVVALFAVNARVISGIVEGVVADNLDTKLDTHIRVLAKAVDAHGRLNARGIASFPELVFPEPGWGWDIRSVAGHWSEGLSPGQIEYPIPRIHPLGGIYSGRGRAASGEGVHVRQLDLARNGKRVRITVLSPRTTIDRELDRVRYEMYWLGGEIILVLVVIAALQLSVGLHPLRKLVKDLSSVLSGNAHLVPERQPRDIYPLAREINALILRKDAALEIARINAANLAHAVKTPLATLMLQLEYEKASAESLQLATHVSERVAHHLHRTRSATANALSRPSAHVDAVLEDVRATMLLVHRSRELAIDIAGSRPCAAAVDAEDLHEIAGNLADNACRHAVSRVVLSAWIEGAEVIMRVEDDGPGIPPEQLTLVLQPGLRLDEMTPGYGLGLAIVRELVELYAGHVTLGRSEGLGGLSARVTLPR